MKSSVNLGSATIANESEALAVADAKGLLVGTLSEAYAARRYAAAIDSAVRGVLGGA